ncbi:hypothetical protein JTB14_027817 [Gonioctena quinquepunctata]|nr:hypothetical protein JTB14_027817 [Gonioctena quinquepunctata]
MINSSIESPKRRNDQFAAPTASEDVNIRSSTRDCRHQRHHDLLKGFKFLHGLTWPRHAFLWPPLTCRRSTACLPNIELRNDRPAWRSCTRSSSRCIKTFMHYTIPVHVVLHNAVWVPTYSEFWVPRHTVLALVPL